jgi:sulfite oxidase
MNLSRRQILQAAGAGGALALLGPLGCSTPGSRSEAKDLIARQETPYNAEPSLEVLSESWITPLRHFFVRSHGPVPVIDPSAYRLSIGGMVGRPVSLSLDQLREFKSISAPATLQCAGNRRGEISRIKPVGGVQWGAGAIGTSEWGGVSLSELLRAANPAPGAKYVWFEGLDEPLVQGKKTAFGASIALEKAMRPETLVALHMNGRPLTADHGAPARAIVPGFVGARSVKWLGKVTLADRPSENYFSHRDYKFFPPEVTAETAKWEERDPIFEYVLSSAICSPRADQTVPAGRLRVRGYSIAPVPLERVEVTVDGGATWTAGRFTGAEAPFTWRLWEAEVEVGKGARVLAVRSTDSRGVPQPESGAWNFKGYLYNGWHRVPVTVA